jgi:hypothetical protein
MTWTAVALIAFLAIMWLMRGRAALRNAKNLTLTIPAMVGETVEVRRNFVCAPTTEALGEMTKSASRGDYNGMGRTVLRTHSIFLDPGMQVKVLDLDGFFERVAKVRVVAADNADPRVGRECWTVAEAIQPK